jgi:hypothetical protein
MALKRKITKAEHDALADVLKAEYKASGDGFVLDTDDATDLQTALEKERQDRRDAIARAKKAEDDLAAATEKKNKDDGNIEALEKSWGTKYEAEKKAREEAEAKLNTERRTVHVNKHADAIAAKFTVPALMSERIAKRLDVEMHDDKPVVRVLDKDGKPSAMSVGDLEKEFLDNPDFKSIVLAGKGSGSATNPQHRAAPEFSLDANGKPPTLDKLSTKELVAHMKATDNSQD